MLSILVFLCSCGPKRMGCGARGICKSPQKIKVITTKSSNLSKLTNQKTPSHQKQNGIFL